MPNPYQSSQPKLKSDDHRIEMLNRKDRRRQAKVTKPYKSRGKYIPAGVNKNV